ncbi:MAG: hypothetical protein AAF587_16975 [Bacteroidota bacterium]
MFINKLERLEIVAFDKAKRRRNGKIFHFFIRPGKYDVRHQNQFMKRRGINTSGRSAKYAFSYSDELALELILDNSLDLQNLPGANLLPTGTIRKQVKDFLDKCFYMDGNTHEPGFLRLDWGDLKFSCRLKQVDITYGAFDSDGKPMRATLNAVFVEDMLDSKRVLLENKKSPDITHSILVKSDSRLPSLCKEVYGDAAEYIRVAKANQLDHFRKLTPGKTINLPPIEK